MNPRPDRIRPGNEEKIMKKYSHLYLALILSFILGVHEGNIALWKEGSTAPDRVFPYQARMLPPEARTALEQGIRFDNLEQLKALAENYLP